MNRDRTSASGAVVTFNNGQEGWQGPQGPGGGSYIDTADGNPANSYRTVFNNFGIDFENSTNPDFIGDFTTTASLDFSVDVRGRQVDFFFQPVSRSLIVEFRSSSLAQGKLDMGKWRAHMPAVCITIPDKPTWSLEDVEQLLAYVRHPAEPTETPADAEGRRFIAIVAGDALVSRFVTQQGMTVPAATRIRKFMLEELRTGDKVQRGYIANQFMLLHWHYTDPEVRTAVLKTAHDPDEFTAHTVRLNLGYTRDWVKRAIAAQRPGVDPTWANDKEIEALAR